MRLQLALKFVYQLDRKKATLISVPDDISIPVYTKGRSNNSISMAMIYFSASMTYGNSI
jgi:hypothetical protein